MIASEAGAFRLKGVVTDEAGVPLADVLVWIEKRKPGDPWNERGRDEHEFRDVDQRFDFKLRGYTSVALHFSTDGYYGTSVQFTTRPDDFQLGEMARIMAGAVVAPPDVEPGELVIVLKKKGQPTTLTKYWGLQYRRDRSGVAIDFDEPPSLVSLEKRAKRDLSQPADWPARGAVVVAAIGADGKFDVARRETPIGRFSVVEGCKLVITGGGIRFYEPRGQRHWSREMTMAPLDGYEPEVPLGEEFVKQRETAPNSKRYFYFKVGDKYGKGQVGMARAYPVSDPQVVSLTIAFYLQPDGSRNLEDDSAR